MTPEQREHLRLMGREVQEASNRIAETWAEFARRVNDNIRRMNEARR